MTSSGPSVVSTASRWAGFRSARYCSGGATAISAMLAGVKVFATRRYPGPAFDELDDVEVASLVQLDAPRDDRGGVGVGFASLVRPAAPRDEGEGLVVAKEPVPLDLLPRLRIVANFGVGFDRID